MLCSPTNEALWHSLWTGEPPTKYHRARRIFRLIPSRQRCKLCYAPFQGIGRPLMLLIGCQPSRLNPHFCNACDLYANSHPGGAEVDVTMLFADLRGSTAIAEQMSPAAFTERMSAFYSAATDVLIHADALLDRIVGDEVGGLFLPITAGGQHARVAIDAARELIAAVTKSVGLPVGAGVHTGVAYVGTIEGAGGTVRDIAAVGDVVNTTARLASAAAPGEILVSEYACSVAGFDISSAPRRLLELKGKCEPFAVHVLAAAG